MTEKYKVVTLCGSAKFKREFLAVQQKLTLEGSIALLPVFFDDWIETADNNAMLKDMHLKRIDMADEIFVINKNGYIGESTKFEIAYAFRTGKKIKYLEQIKS